MSPEQLRFYEQHFNLVFNTDDPPILNTAIMGSFGAGKSTIARSWDAQDKDREYLYVSVARFDDEGGKTDAASPAIRREIESRLINQLVHKVDSKRVPMSRFRRTANLPIRHHFGAAAAAAILVSLNIGLGHLLARESLGNIALPVALASIAMVALIVGIAVSYVMRHGLITRLLSSFSFMGIDVSVDDGKQETLFDNYLDDLLYILDGSDIDVVVFEDLDRYNLISPFEDLREINDLANARRRQRGAKPLRFFYLVRPSLFPKPADKEKLFDYIVPVISYVDSNNAYSLLRDHLMSNSIEPTDECMRKVSVFIHDPRILNEIVNESWHYKNCLFDEQGLDQFTTEDADKLLCLMTYKVLFPADFERLQHDCGFLNELLNSRERLVKLVESQRREMLEHAEEELSELLQKRDSDDIGKIVTIDIRGPHRHVGLKTRVAYLEARVTKLEQVLETTPFESLSTLMSAYGFDNLVAHIRSEAPGPADGAEGLVHPLNTDEIDEIHKSHYLPFLKSALLDGYIDDSYSRYISGYQTDVLSVKDQSFVRGLLGDKAHLANVVLDNPKQVLRTVTPNDLRRHGAWNYSLLQEIAQSGTAAQQQAFAESLTTGDSESFLYGYARSKYYHRSAYRITEDSVVKLLRRAVDNGDFTLDTTTVAQQYISYLFNDITEVPLTIARVIRRRNSVVKEYVEHDPNILWLQEGAPSRDQMLGFLDSLDYEAGSIDMEKADRGLLESIYHREMFTCDARLIAQFLEIFECDSDLPADADVLSILHSKPQSPAYKRVDCQMGTFIRSYLDTDFSVPKSSEIITWVLRRGRKGFDSRVLTQFVSRIGGTAIENLEEIDDKYVDAVVKRRRFRVNAKNFEFLFFRKRDDWAEVVPLNRSLTRMALSGNPTFLRELENPGPILQALAASKGFDDKWLYKVARNYPKAIEYLKSGIPQDRLKMLLRWGSVAVNQYNLQKIRAEYGLLVRDFCNSDPYTYVDLILALDASQRHWAQRPNLDVREARMLIQNGQLPEELEVRLRHVVESNGERPDIYKTIHLLDRQDISPANRDLLIERMAELLEEPDHPKVRIRYPLLLEALVRSNADPTQILTEQFEMMDKQLEFSEAQMEHLLMSAGYPAVAYAKSGEHVTVPSLATTKHLFTELQRLGYCTVIDIGFDCLTLRKG